MEEDVYITTRTSSTLQRQTETEREREREREREMALERDSFFHVLRSKSTNKMCFDCNSRNPDWASVQHGVIICIGAYALDSNHSLVDVCMRVSFRERMRVCVCVCVCFLVDESIVLTQREYLYLCCCCRALLLSCVVVVVVVVRDRLRRSSPFTGRAPHLCQVSQPRQMGARAADDLRGERRESAGAHLLYATWSE